LLRLFLLKALASFEVSLIFSSLLKGKLPTTSGVPKERLPSTSGVP